MDLRLLMYCRGQFLDNEVIKKWLGMFIVASKKLDFLSKWCSVSFSGSPSLMNEHYGRLTFGQMERIMVIEKNTKLKEPEAA